MRRAMLTFRLQDVELLCIVVVLSEEQGFINNAVFGKHLNLPEHLGRSATDLEKACLKSHHGTFHCARFSKTSMRDRELAAVHAAKLFMA